MTEKRKTELRQLLNEAMKDFQIRFMYAPLTVPIDVYGRYLQERWNSYGVDFLSFTFSIYFSLDIVNEDKKSKLLDFIGEEVAPFIDNDHILSSSYVLEDDPTDRFRVFCPKIVYLQLNQLLERLLQIVIVQGVEEAVWAFDRSSHPEGSHALFQYVALLEGIKVETEVQIFEGVRLVPLPSSKISEEFVQYLPGFPSHVLIDIFGEGSFFRKTLLVIDRPGFSIFHRPPEKPFEHRIQVDDLPFQAGEHDTKFPKFESIKTFGDFFCQSLSLACNSPVQINHITWFFEEEKSLHIQTPGRHTIYPSLGSGPFANFIEVEQSEIEEARSLYKKLLDVNPSIRKKLEVPIDRWIKSKTENNPVDKMIDLGIAFEALYLSDISETSELSFRLRLRAAWYLKKKKEDRNALMKEFTEIYRWRSSVVHTGKFPEKSVSKRKKRPFTQEEIAEFITKAQDLCRDSIMKILEDGEFPDWNNLILG